MTTPQNRSGSANRDKIVEKAIAALTISIFALASTPGLAAIWIFAPAWIAHMQVDAGEIYGGPDGVATFVLRGVIPQSDTLPANVTTLLLAAGPVAILRSCFAGGQSEHLSKVGTVALGLAALGFASGLVGGFLINPESTFQTQNIATAPILQKYEALIDRATYFALLYILIFTRLRPKP